MMKRLLSLALIIAVLFATSAPLLAGEEKSATQRFEEELSTPPEKSHESRYHEEKRSHHAHHEDGVTAGEVATQSLMDLFAQFFLAGLMTTSGEPLPDMYRFDVQPSWAYINGHNVYDLDSGLSFKWKFAGIRAAYRALFVGDSTTLHGPKVGVFFQW